MSWHTLRRRTLWVVLVTLAGCGALDVSDPTAVEDDELQDAAGANLLRNDAIGRLSIAVTRGVQFSGLMSDEYIAITPSYFALYGYLNYEEMMDRRQNAELEQFDGGYEAGLLYGAWQDVRRSATVAIPKLRTYGTAARVGEMFAVRGYASLRLAEDVCPGFPLHEVVDYKLVYGPPLTTEQALLRALEDFDSAVVYAVDSARILEFARVGRGRVLLNLGRLSEAAAAVAGVPGDYELAARFTSGEYGNQFTIPDAYGRLFHSVANDEGGTGIDFVVAADPRVPTVPAGTAEDVNATDVYAFVRQQTETSPVVIANGIEARLIEAEAALAQGGDTWRQILSQLRQDHPSLGLDALSDPGSPEARLDLLFRERAFWLFGTGHRLADLRRLVVQYGRPVESVFPTGAYQYGGTYATAVTLPFPAATETVFNPAVTGCTSR